MILTRSQLSRKWQRHFWARVRIGGPDECWPWTAALNSAAYGVVGFDYKTYLAHRIAFLLEYGYMPERQGKRPD